MSDHNESRDGRYEGPNPAAGRGCVDRSATIDEDIDTDDRSTTNHTDAVPEFKLSFKLKDTGR